MASDGPGVSAFTIFGARGRGHCPVPVNKWSNIKIDEKSKSGIEVECGSTWSEWADSTGDNQTQCGDRFQKRTRVDKYGLTSEETRNIG